MKMQLINNKIRSEGIRSKSYEMRTGNLLIVKKSEPATIKTNNRSHNLSELNINKISN